MSYKTLVTCLKRSILAAALLFFQYAQAQTDFKDLDQAIDARQKILGKDFVLSIWKKGDTLVYQKKAGVFNGKTVAPIASSSKWLTAALVMQFIDEGKLSLDDKISKWLPEYEKYGKNYITIRHCLSHQTGIKSDPPTLGKLFSRKKFASLQEEVDDFASKEIQTNPGTEFRYSTVGLNIAARVLEVISKKRFEQLIKQKLFNPLTMRNTSFSNLEGGAVNPSGGATSTADDYMKFLVMLMNDGQYNGKTILSKASVEEMRRQQVTEQMMAYAPKAAQGYTYALGAWVLASRPATDGGLPLASVLASPGLFGTWPMIDFCRGYAYLVVVKELLGEDKAAVHMELKEIIDKKFTLSCP